MPDRPRALSITDIPNLSIKPDGDVDNKFLVSTVNSIKDKLLQIATIIRGNRSHFGLHARKTQDASANKVAELTISSGAITVTQSYHSVDTENDTASDILDTINGGTVGDIIILEAENDARSVVVTDGTGLKLEGSANFTLDDSQDKIELIRHNSTEWHELSRSSNG